MKKKRKMNKNKIFKKQRQNSINFDVDLQQYTILLSNHFVIFFHKLLLRSFFITFKANDYISIDWKNFHEWIPFEFIFLETKHWLIPCNFIFCPSVNFCCSAGNFLLNSENWTHAYKEAFIREPAVRYCKWKKTILFYQFILKKSGCHK